MYIQKEYFLSLLNFNVWFFSGTKRFFRLKKPKVNFFIIVVKIVGRLLLWRLCRRRMATPLHAPLVTGKAARGSETEFSLIYDSVAERGTVTFILIIVNSYLFVYLSQNYFTFTCLPLHIHGSGILLGATVRHVLAKPTIFCPVT